MKDWWRSVDESAEYFSIKRDTAYRWISEKHILAHKVGRLWKFKKEEIDEWVKSDSAGETADH
jgi:excisionase family DNA binding protein